MRNHGYTVAYWEEHAANFEAMLRGLLDEPTLLKVASNASALVLQYNHVKAQIPPEYNQKTLLAAYEILDSKLNKDLLFQALSAYMEVVSPQSCSAH